MREAARAELAAAQARTWRTRGLFLRVRPAFLFRGCAGEGRAGTARPTRLVLSGDCAAAVAAARRGQGYHGAGRPGA